MSANVPNETSEAAGPEAAPRQSPSSEPPKAPVSAGSRLRIAALAALLLLSLTFAYQSFRHSLKVDSVAVTFIGSGKEVRDKVVLGMGAKDELPDYRLDFILAQYGKRAKRFKCATLTNQSAAQGISFLVPEGIPLRAVREIVLVENDKLNDDVVVQAQLTASRFEAKDYRFEVSSSRDFTTGLEWFFSTPVGKAVFWGIVLSILGSVLLFWQRVFPG